MKAQNFETHRRFIPAYHFFIFSLTIAILIGALVNLIKTINAGEGFYSASLIFAISVVLIFFFFFMRMFALRAQDRAIRAEENFRHFLLTGKPLDRRLKMSQIVALRFASEGEFPELAKNAIENNLSSLEIKKSIKLWKPDHHRA